MMLIDIRYAQLVHLTNLREWGGGGGGHDSNILYSGKHWRGFYIGKFGEFSEIHQNTYVHIMHTHAIQRPISPI